MLCLKLKGSMVDNDSLPCILVFDFLQLIYGLKRNRRISCGAGKTENESGELILVSSVSLPMFVQQ